MTLIKDLNSQLATLERQQMLERERAVVENLHNQGVCMGLGGCIICKEKVMAEDRVFDAIPQAPGTLTLTLKDRGAEYGDYREMAELAQRIKDLMRSDETHWFKLAPHERESLDMIALKMARIVCGRHSQQDSWHDIRGYAKLAEDRCPPGGGRSVSAREPDAGDWPPATS
jgi:hypothetical protein